MSQTAIKGRPSTGSERRVYQRYAANLDALVSSNKNQVLTCSIRDYCLGGMLVVFADDEASQQGANLNANDLVSIDFSLVLDGVTKTLTQQCRIARLVAGGLGLVFVDPAPVFLETLKEFTKVTVSPTTPKDRNRPTPRLTNKVRKAVSICQRAVNTQLPLVYREIFHRSRKALSEFASRDIRTTQERRTIADDIQVLETVWDKKESVFLGHLHKQIVQMVHKETAILSGWSDETEYQLALVDQSDFEDWLCITDLAIKIREYHRRALHVLSQQLNSLSALPEANIELPVAPNVFGGAIHEILQPLSVGADTQHIIFEVAANVLAEKLGDFYSHLTDELETNNAVSDKQARDRNGGAAINYGFRHLEPTPQFLTDHTEPSVEQKPIDNGPATNDESQLNQADLTNLLQSIQQVQDPLPEAESTESSADNPDSNHSAANQAENEHDTPALEAAPDEQSETTEKLFEILRRDEQLSENVIPWIRSLSQPLLNASLVDPRFFDNRQHPLRKLVNQLEHMDMFIDREDRSKIATRVDPIDELVQEAATSLQDNEGVPGELSSQLGIIETQISRDYEQNVEQVVLACEGLQRATHAEQEVRDQVNRQLSGQQVPRIVSELLEAGWLLLLQRTYVREGGEGSTWKQYLFVLERLLQRLSKPHPAESQSGQEGLELYRVVEYAIDSVSFDPYKKKALLDALRNLIVDDCQQPPDAEPDMVEFKPLKAGGEGGSEANQSASTEPAAPEGVSDSTWNDILEQARDLREGNRFNVVTPDGSSRTYRLVWIGDNSSKFVFVDYRGRKAQELDLAQVADKLHSGELSLKQEPRTPLIDRLAAAMLEDAEA